MNQNRILITGVTSCRNRGVEALVLAKCQGFKNHIPNARVSIMTLDENYDRLRVAGVADTMPNRMNYSIRKSRGPIKFIRGLVGKDYIASNRAAIASAACVVVTGGDIFSSDYGNFESFLHPLQLAQQYGVPSVFLAHSIGPFKTKSEADVWVEVAAKAALITVRESLTQKYLVESLGLPPEKVILTADVAFLLPIPEPAVLRQLHAYYGIDGSTPVVALATSEGINRYAGLDGGKHVEFLVQTVKMIRNELGAKVLLVPHVQERDAADDDRILTTRILREMNWDSGVMAAHAHHSASEFKGLISGCNLVIAERMHAAIAGLGTGIPTVVIGYSVKGRGIMQEFFGERGLDYVIPSDAYSDKDAREAKIRNVWNQRAATASQIKEKLPLVRSRADHNFELVAKLIK
jgi:colanic acid/amylovoran biosynthesis protein